MKNLTKHHYSIDKQKRNEQNNHKSFLVWFTGLSGSGKSTLANLLEIELHSKGIHTYHLDGDNLRLGLNSDLTFSETDRSENNRRVGELANLMLDAGIVTIAAFVSPFQKDRERVKSIVGAENFLEIYINTDIEECIKRDTKGLYKKAISGEISEFTGISSPYEEPTSPDLIINTAEINIEESLQLVLHAVLLKLNNHE